MFGFVRDLRYALRTLRKSQGFTIVAVLTLALGIGVNVATFGVVYSVLLRPLPFPQAEQLVRVFDDLRGPNEQDVGMSAPELWDLQDRSGVFQSVSAVAPSSSAVGGGDRTVRAESLVTSPDYFVLLGTKPELGRVYTPEDAAPGFMEPVVISALGQFAPVNAVVFCGAGNDAEHLGEAVRHEVESVDPNVSGAQYQLHGSDHRPVGGRTAVCCRASGCLCGGGADTRRHRHLRCDVLFL